jgi:Arf-GAP/GTPase/ANK repeat/PH domain-containing protein 1/3
LNASDKFKNRNSSSSADSAIALSIRAVNGNSTCADCNCPNPDWASLNLGVIICIECSGIHRNLGTHLSRVRSLDLDEWPYELVILMTSIGNTVANSIWEANTQNRTRPSSASPREEKEKWIRAKYEQKAFIPPLPYQDVSVTQQLIDAVARQDVQKTIHVLAHSSPDHVNMPYSKSDTRTALHIASALGNVIQVQLLLWHGANVRSADHEGHYALHYAYAAGSQDCIRVLLLNGSPDISHQGT